MDVGRFDREGCINACNEGIKQTEERLLWRIKGLKGSVVTWLDKATTQLAGGQSEAGNETMEWE